MTCERYKGDYVKYLEWIMDRKDVKKVKEKKKDDKRNQSRGERGLCLYQS